MNDFTKNPMYKYLMVLVICASAGLQGWMAMITNFATDVVKVNGFQMGMTQSVREIPGFLTFLALFVLLIVKEHKLSAISVLVMGIGIGATGFFTSLTGLLMTTVVMSVGFHYFETTNKSLTVQYFNKLETAIVFARLRGYGAAANILVLAIILWLAYMKVPYKYTFLALGIFISCVGIYMLTQNPIREVKPHQDNMPVLYRKYWLYYVLNFLSGARRQIFIVFAIFLLVKKYGLSVEQVIIIYAINFALTYITNPLISKAINKYGERVVLSLESGSLVILFLGYAFVQNVWVVIGLYVMDSIFFNFAIGLNTYLQKTADSKDLAQSTAVGFTINHISAVIIPLFGGAMWMLNWRLPFIIGAGITLVSLYFTQKIKIMEHR